MASLNSGGGTAVATSPTTAGVGSPPGAGGGNLPHHHPYARHSSSAEFLELNVRDVFENTTIEKTLEIQKRLGVEIERKKEEIRVLVGERYRDLIDAADTIGTMKANSNEIYEKLVELRTKLSTFPSVPKTAAPAPLPSGKKLLKPKELEIACKLKLSQELPRQIQLQLHKENTTRALHFYLLYVKKIKDVLTNYKWTFLQGEDNVPGGGPSSPSVEMALKEGILNSCAEAMGNFETSSEKLTECIIVKSVLNSMKCEETLKEFLESRVAHCREILANPQQRQHGEIEREDQLIQYISRTLVSIYQIFIEPELYNSTSKLIRHPKISSLELGFCSFIPASIEQFNNEKIFIEDPPRIGKLTELILVLYIPPLKTLLEEAYGNGQYLAQFSTLVELMSYKQKCCLLLQSECDNFGRILFGSHVKTLWAELFQGIFHLKCQAVIRQKIEQIFKDNSGIYSKYKEADVNFDLVNFIWKQNETSSTSTSGDTSTANSSSETETLKLKCLTPNIASVCSELENSFLSLLEDFKAVVQPSNSMDPLISPSPSQPSAAGSGPSLLKEYMSTTILENFQQFLLNSSTADNSLFLARILTAIFDLCPTIWKVLEKQDLASLRQSCWTRSESCWKCWSEIELLATFQKELKLRIPNLSPEIVVELMPVGEVYKPSMSMQQQQQGSSPSTNQEQQVVQEFESSIRVPIQLSHILHGSLFQLCLQLANVGPQSISKTVRDSIRQSLGETIIAFYHDLIENGENGAPRVEGPEEGSDVGGSGDNAAQISISAQIAIQFIFDLKFIQWFHPKLSGGEQVEGLLAKLQACIDPFDWDIVGSRLNLNLKRFLFENHLTLGLLLSEESLTFIAQNFKTKHNQTHPVLNKGLLTPLPLLPI